MSTSLFKKVIFLVGISGICLPNVYAEALSANLKVFKIESSQKKKELKSTEQVQPSTALEYQVTYSNNTSNNLKNLKLNLPLPTYVSYVGTSLPANILASTDGINFAKAPLTKVVNGKKVNVPLNEYRALQWNISELKAKQSTTVSAQVRVNTAE